MGLGVGAAELHGVQRCSDDTNLVYGLGDTCGTFFDMKTTIPQILQNVTDRVDVRTFLFMYDSPVLYTKNG